MNFQTKFEEELEISRRQNLKGPGDINNLQLQDVQGILYFIPKVGSSAVVRVVLKLT